MKKLFLTFAIPLAFVAAAHAQSTSDGNYTNNDTLFRFIFKSDSIYIMSNDVKGYEKHTDWTTYHLTTKKYRQLNNIKVKIGEFVLFSEKTPDGQWERIPVFIHGVTTYQQAGFYYASQNPNTDITRLCHGKDSQF